MRALPFVVVAVLSLSCARGHEDQHLEAPAATRGPAARQARVAVLLPEGPASFRVELADDEAARARGLMFREALGDDEGMLFIFERTQPLSFWMKNTLIALDMLFIDERGAIVGIVENAEPLTETARRVDGAARYVLELKGGTCGKRGIASGMRLRFEGIPGHPVAAPDAMR